MDDSLLADPEIVFHAGTHADAMRMRLADFMKLGNPVCSPSRKFVASTTATDGPVPEVWRAALASRATRPRAARGREAASYGFPARARLAPAKRVRQRVDVDFGQGGGALERTRPTGAAILHLDAL